MSFICHNGIILAFDELIFFKMVIAHVKTTNQILVFPMRKTDWLTKKGSARLDGFPAIL
jgi:hypothetical protein